MLNWFKRFSEKDSDSNHTNIVPEIIKTTYRPAINETIKPEILIQIANIKSISRHHYLDYLSMNYNRLAQEILKQDANLTDDEWSSIQTKVKQTFREYQSLFVSYNIELTRKYCNIPRKLNASSSRIKLIFEKKQAAYKAMDNQTFERCRHIERHLLKEWNSKLTTEAESYFNEADEVKMVNNKSNVEAIFDCKKLVSINLYVLEHPNKRNFILANSTVRDDYFKTINYAINCLKNYLTQDLPSLKGRYNNASTPSRFWSCFSWSRKQKLHAALEYCDRIVLNAYGNTSLNKTGALSQGNLSSVIDGFIDALREFAQNTQKLAINSPSDTERKRKSRINLIGLDSELSSLTNIFEKSRSYDKNNESKIDLFFKKYIDASMSHLKASEQLTAMKISFFDEPLSLSIEDAINRSRSPEIGTENQAKLDSSGQLCLEERGSGLYFFEMTCEMLTEICISYFVDDKKPWPDKNTRIDKVLDQQERLYSHFCLAYTIEPQRHVLEMIINLSSHIKNFYGKECNHAVEREVRTAMLCSAYLITTGGIPEQVWNAQQMNEGQIHESEGKSLKKLVLSFQANMAFREKALSDAHCMLQMRSLAQQLKYQGFL